MLTVVIGNLNISAPHDNIHARLQMCSRRQCKATNRVDRPRIGPVSRDDLALAPFFGRSWQR